MSYEDETARWMSSAQDAAAAQGFEQIDLDDLLNAQPEDALAAGMACVRAAAEALGSDSGLIPLLVVPLDVSDTLTQKAPDLSTLSDTPWPYGPGRVVPGVYLVRPDHLHYPQVSEEYRRAVESPEPGWYAEYRTWREQESAARGWEYARAFYLRLSL